MLRIKSSVSSKLKVITFFILITLIMANCSRAKVEVLPPVDRSSTVAELTEVDPAFSLETKDPLDGTIYRVSIIDTAIITERTLNSPYPGPTLTRTFDPVRKQIVRAIALPNSPKWVEKVFVEGKTDSDIFQTKICVEWEHLSRMNELVEDSNLVKLQSLFNSYCE